MPVTVAGPPTTRSPSGWTATALAAAAAPTGTVTSPPVPNAASSAPAAVSRTAAKTLTPPTVSEPTTTTRPSGRTASAAGRNVAASGLLLTPSVPKVPSSAPAAVTRAAISRVPVAARLPTTTTDPSGDTAVSTSAAAPAANLWPGGKASGTSRSPAVPNAASGAPAAVTCESARNSVEPAPAARAAATTLPSARTAAPKPEKATVPRRA